MNQPHPVPDPQNNDSLAREASCLHRSIFHDAIPQSMTRRYIAAHHHINPPGTKKQFQTIRKVVDLDLDAEAVEYALRQQGKNHPLLDKMKIITYLAECEERYSTAFINQGSSFWRTLLIMAAQIIRSVFKRIKGTILVWRHSLV